MNYYFLVIPFMKIYLKKLSSKMNLKLTKIGIFKKFNKEFLKFKNNNSKPKNSYLHF